MGSCLSSKMGGSRSRYTDTSSPSTSGSVRGRLATANIITMDGRLREYALPATASQVLVLEDSYYSKSNKDGSASASGGSSSSIVLCNADSLCFDDHITALEPHRELQPDQIYFVLPVSKLQHPLSASDMAALAVKATTVLPVQNQRRRRRRRHSLKTSTDRSSSSSSSSGSHRSNRISSSGSGSSRRISPAVQQVSGYDEERTIKRSGGYGGAKGVEAAAAAGISRSSSLRKLHKYSAKRARMAVRSFRLRLTTIYEGSVLEIGRSSRHYYNQLHLE